MTRNRLGVPALLFAACFSLAAQSMRELGDQRGVRIGAAVDPNRFSESLYAATLSREFSQVEPENVMKFTSIHPAVNTYTFGPADQIVSFARANNMAVRGHTMVWHNQVPGWVGSAANTPAQLAAILQQHIQTVAGHFAGQVFAWDVVNEAFLDDGSLRGTIWSNAPGIGLTGTGYIEQAFRWTHDADPQALLFYNDYSAETVNSKSNAIFQMAQDFVARGVPMHGIGLQMHFTTSPPSLSGIESNIRRITALGLQVHITELDVRLAVDSAGTATPALLATQAQIYKDVVSVCLKFPLCSSIQTWGFTDRYSWIPGSFPGLGAGLPFDRAYQPKPAYNSMLDSLSNSPPVFSASGLTNAASYAAGAISPGEITVLFGASFGPASLALAQFDAAGKLPPQLAGTRLLFDGVPAPLLYSRVGQVSAIVPFSLAGKTSVPVVYEYRGLQSLPVDVTVFPAAPGIFSLDSSGKGAGAILDAAYHVISAASPARPGDVVLIFATGGGVTIPPGSDGGIATQGDLAAKPAVRIGGIDCPVLYAGAAPGIVAGAVQLNIRIPAGVPPGKQPVILKIGAVESQADVTIDIAAP